MKEKDNKGNLKIDYKINKIKIQEEEKTYKTIPIVGGIEKFLKDDLKNTAIRFTIDGSGRFQSLDNKDENRRTLHTKNVTHPFRHSEKTNKTQTYSKRNS